MAQVILFSSLMYLVINNRHFWRDYFLGSFLVQNHWIEHSIGLFFTKIDIKEKGILIVSGNKDSLGVILSSNIDIARIYGIKVEDLYGI